MRPDPVRLEVFHHLLASICEEAGGLLQRSAISPNIRERRDFSFALFDEDGRLAAQAAHIPVHLGSAGESVRAVREALDVEPGDVAILNDPYRGGTHLPDVTLVRPVFVGKRRRPSFFLVDRAHHADIGGATRGSMGVARELYAEGLVIPPVKLRARGEPVRAVLDMIAANVRGAQERVIDLHAQEAALAQAERRLLELCEANGLATVQRYARYLMDYTETIARGVVQELPKGRFAAEDIVEDDGLGAGPFVIRLVLRRRGDVLEFDWRDSAAEARGGVNANPNVVLAASAYVLRCLCPERLPTNEGLFRVIEVKTRPGTVLDPRPPAPVAGGNVETSQRIVDVAMQALAKAWPGRMPACSAGTMSNVTIGGPGYSLYETLPGGAGAGPSGAGASAIQTHMTNTRNTPVEETELRHPLRVVAFTVRRGSGGAGARRGGDGLVKEVEVLAPATASLFAERARTRPPGGAGGGAGKGYRATVRTDGKRRSMPSKVTFDLPKGSRLRIETPGGGGHGAG
jgi:N-methylhydantoinase B